MVKLRGYETRDLEALYHICLVTGAAGQDASGLHNDPKVVGHVYAAPYGVLEPAQVILAEDEQGVAGYIVGTYDTDAFARRLEQEWWPALRQHYSTIPQDALTEEDWSRVEAIRHPHEDPADIVARYPAHIHMNLLPRLRGKRVGTALLQQWVGQARADGVSGIHLGANAGNTGGIAFWQSGGFKPLQTIGHSAWFGMSLED